MLTIALTPVRGVNVESDVPSVDASTRSKTVADLDHADNSIFRVEKPEHGLWNETRFQLCFVCLITTALQIFLQCCFAIVNNSTTESILAVCKIGKKFGQSFGRIE